ncbi:Cloroperoxidase [Thozetella sp. PMI_491]|nr:Cloroperoxidase [Thozetella sp. PMI_491]
MKFSVTCMLFGASQAFSWTHPRQAESSGFTWQAPGPDDVRAPCPMLNTLANHGFLPRSGKDITENDTVQALGTGLNIDAALAKSLHSAAVRTNPDTNATTFSLDNLSRHNILEHDASLSRTDAIFGDPQPFNETVFNQTRSFWTDETITVQMAADARSARIKTSMETNPNFTMSNVGKAFSLGESAAYILAFGDKDAGTSNRSFVEFMFLKEQLPYELGWTKGQNIFTSADLANMMQRITNATSAVSPEAAQMNGRGIHEMV